MSNVLIGIIGVILFIGLALAGALFLGPRFQESTNNSRASAAVQAVSQVSSAANMYNVQEGKKAASADVLETTGYLKAVPSNPAGTVAPTYNSTTNLVEMPITSGPVCLAIVKQTQGTATTAIPNAASGTAGCYQTGSGETATYTAFASV